MKILAIDSTALTASVALCEDGHLISLITQDAGQTHSETLLPLIESLLCRSRVSLSDIDIFACTEGPGSFTGVRIGAATIKGLAFGREKPCIGVSTLDALAGNLSFAEGIVCPLMNARRGQVYNALFLAKGGNLTKLTPDRTVSLDELEAELKKYELPVYLCGDGVSLAEEKMECIKFIPVSDNLRRECAYSAAQQALQKFKNGTITSDTELTPTYLRLPQAERERLERLNTQK